MIREGLVRVCSVGVAGLQNSVTTRRPGVTLSSTTRRSPGTASGCRLIRPCAQGQVDNVGECVQPTRSGGLSELGEQRQLVEWVVDGVPEHVVDSQLGGLVEIGGDLLG